MPDGTLVSTVVGTLDKHWVRHKVRLSYLEGVLVFQWEVCTQVDLTKPDVHCLFG